MTKPITARFSGVCTATRQRYQTGTEIQRGPKGWQLATTTREFRGELSREANRNEYRAVKFAANCHENCEYCDRPLDRGTVCDRCARACGETEWSEPDPYDVPDFDDY